MSQANRSKGEVRNNAMMDQLSALLPRMGKFQGKSAGKRPPVNARARLQLMDLGTIGEDGVTHINIYNRAKTSLGVLLANNTELRFGHSTYGFFMTIEGFWRYIRTNMVDEAFRTLSPERLLAYSKQYEQVVVPNFQAIIAEACWMKVKSYQEIVDVLRQVDLPFDYYYVDSGNDSRRVRPKFAPWMIEVYEEIRKAIKEDREPNFTFLRDNRNGPMRKALDARWEVRKAELAEILAAERAAKQKRRRKAVPVEPVVPTESTVLPEPDDDDEQGVPFTPVEVREDETNEIQPEQDIVIPEPEIDDEDEMAKVNPPPSSNVDDVVSDYIRECVGSER